jgi:hypothetical protein
MSREAFYIYIDFVSLISSVYVSKSDIVDFRLLATLGSAGNQKFSQVTATGHSSLTSATLETFYSYCRCCRELDLSLLPSRYSVDWETLSVQGNRGILLHLGATRLLIAREAH